MATTVTATHHSIWRHLYDSMHAAQKPKSKLKFVTLNKESNMSTLWRREEFLRICSKEELAERAQDIEVTIPVKKSQEAQYKFDPESFFANRFWGRRPDGVAINEALQIVYIFEFKLFPACTRRSSAQASAQTLFLLQIPVDTEDRRESDCSQTRLRSMARPAIPQTPFDSLC